MPGGPGRARRPWLRSRQRRQNRELRVFNAAGYYDFATPFFEVELDFARNGVVAERVTYAYYESGHMMYVHEPSLEKLMDDVRAFIVAGTRD
jgi:carboxypeptidase C (cathepsin A)